SSRRQIRCRSRPTSAAPAYGHPWKPRARPGLADQREAFRMLDRINRQVDVEIGPVEMIRRQPVNTSELCNRRIAEPRELLEREKQLSLVEQQPEAVSRDVGYLNAQNALATRSGFHPRAPAPASALPQSALGSIASSGQRKSLGQARSWLRQSRDEHER